MRKQLQSRIVDPSDNLTLGPVEKEQRRRISIIHITAILEHWRNLCFIWQKRWHGKEKKSGTNRKLCIAGSKTKFVKTRIKKYPSDKVNLKGDEKTS